MLDSNENDRKGNGQSSEKGLRKATTGGNALHRNTEISTESSGGSRLYVCKFS